MSVPRIVHQLWGFYDHRPISESHVAAFHRSWSAHNSGCEVRVWGPRECDALVRGRYAWFWPTYEKLQAPIHKVDIVRPLILHAHGGVYVDADIECTKPIEPLFRLCENSKSLLVFHSHHWPHLTNSFLMGPAAHPFWEAYVRLAQARIQAWWWPMRQSQITTIAMTGPVMLHSAFRQTRVRHAFTVLDHRTLFAKPGMHNGTQYGIDHLDNGYGKHKNVFYDIVRLLFLLSVVYASIVLVIRAVR